MSKWIVKYRLKGDMIRNLRELVVDANNAFDAIKVAQSNTPSAEIVGGAKQFVTCSVDKN